MCRSERAKQAAKPGSGHFIQKTHEKKILLIEDNEAILKNTATILELAGYEVVSADNGKTGIRLDLKER